MCASHDSLLLIVIHRKFVSLSCLTISSPISTSNSVVTRPVARGGSGGHDPPMKLTVACAAGHFAPVRSATKHKVVQTVDTEQWSLSLISCQL